MQKSCPALFGALLAMTLPATSFAHVTDSIVSSDWLNSKQIEASRYGLYVDYVICAETAADHILSRDLTEHCEKVYQLLKLSFLSEVTLSNYNAMQPNVRAATNKKALDAFLLWLADQTPLEQ